MRICPKCGFSNSEEFATCVWCNRSLADVARTKPEDPNDPEHEEWERRKRRHDLLHRQLIEAVVLYAVVIAFCVAAGLGYNMNWWMLLCAMAGGLAVGAAVVHGLLGQLTAPLAQAAFSAALAIYFGLLTPIMFFSMAGHVFAAVLLSIWVDLIYDTRR